MIIEYKGHSCFKITTSGQEFLFDPYDDSVGYTVTKTSADVVLVSHDHYDHTNTDMAIGEYTLVNKPSVVTFGDVIIEGFTTYHDKSQGSERGKNIAYLLKSEGIRLLHLGDIGDMPSKDMLERIGKIDILLLPVGGTYTLDAKEAAELAREIDANITIPMHYKTVCCSLDIDPVYMFLEASGRCFDKSRLEQGVFEIDARNLKKRSRIMVMECTA